MKSHKAIELTDEKYQRGLAITAGSRTDLDIVFKETLNSAMETRPDDGYGQIIKVDFVNYRLTAIPLLKKLVKLVEDIAGEESGMLHEYDEFVTAVEFLESIIPNKKPEIIIDGQRKPRPTIKR